MPDNLTQKFKDDLEARAKRITTPSPMPTPGAPTSGRTLWETVGTTAEPDWLEGSLDSEGSVIRTAGLGLWGFLETGTLGLAGLAARGVAPDWARDSLQPRNFAERVATGLGTVGGFIVPFGAAKTGAAALLKGAKVVRDGKVVGYGAARASEKFISNASRVLKADPAFKQWYAKQGLDPKKVTQWIEKSGLLQAPKASIKGVTRGHFGSSHAARTQYAANVAKNTESIIRKKVDSMAKAFAKKGDDVPFDVTDRSIGLMKDEVTKYLGGKYNFPITNLHQYLAVKWGNSKMASLAASAAEEAILFSAVELPMNLANSIWNEDIDFAPFSTLGHSMTLGSALGVIRLIPGGRDMGIMKTAWGRANQFLTRRKRWSNYNVNDASERMLLTRRAQDLWDNNPEIFKGLAGTKLYKSGGKSTVSSREEITKFAESPESARELRSWMSSVEKSFYKDWWPGFLKDSGKDVFGSMPRMIAGSVAFNAGLFNEYRQGNVPTEDMVFHTLLGAVMTKRGRDVEYIDHNGRTQLIPENRRPRVYDESFEKVDSYLNSLGLKVDHAAFNNLMNNMDILKKHGKPDYSTDDMQRIFKSLEERGFVVDASEELTHKNKNISGNDIYDTLGILMEGAVPEGKRLKQSIELSESELADYLVHIRGLELKSLQDYRTDSSKTGTGTGIYSVADIRDVAQNSASRNIETTLDVHKRAVEDAYNIILKEEARQEGKDKDDWMPVSEDANGKLPLRKIRYDNSSPIEDYERVMRLFGNGRNDGEDGFKSALGSIKDRVVMIEGDKNEIVYNEAMHRKLFGDKASGDRGEMDKYDRELTTEMFGEGVMSDDALLHVGDAYLMDGIQSHMFAKGIRDTWLEFEAIRNGDTKKSVFGDDVNNIQPLLDRAFSGGPGLSGKELPTGIVLTQGGKQINPNSKEQLFASNVLEILKQQKERYGINEEISGAVTKKMDVAQISELMEKFDAFGILDGFKGNREAVDTFVANLAHYTRTKGLEMSTRNDGSPLTPKDLAIMEVLTRTRLMGKNYDMAMLTDQIGNLKDFFLSTDIINKYNLKAEDVDGISKSLLKWTRDNDSTVKEIFQDLESANKNLYNLFIDAAEKMDGVGRENVSMLLGDFLSLYEESLAPLWRTRNGGILKETPTKAAITSDYLFKLVSEFNRIKTGEINMTHRDLLAAIDDVYYNTASNQYRDFLQLTLNSVIDRKGDVTRVIEILKRYKLFNPKTNVFLFDEADKTLTDKIKDASKEIEVATQTLPVEREIDILMQRDKQDFSPKSHSDTHVSLTLEKFKKDWGLKYTTPDFIYGQTPASMLQTIVTDMPGGFTLSNFFDYTVKKGEMNKEIDGKVYTQKNWKEMPEYQLERFVNDVIKIWSGITEGVKVRNLKIGEGEIPLDAPGSARRNDLTDFLSSEFGESVFIDAEFYGKDGIKRNVKETTGDLRVGFYTGAARVGQKAEGRLATTEAEAYDYFAGDKKPQSGYIVAWLADVESGIGIPITTAEPGRALSGIHKLSNRFVDTLNEAKERWKDNRDISNYIDRMISQYVKTEDTRIVDTFDVDAEGNPINYKFRGEIPADERTSDHATVMLTTVFGNKQFGKNFWDSLVNSKANTKGWSAEKEFAHDSLRRMRLFTNRTTTNLNNKRIKEITDFMDKTVPNNVMSDMREIINTVLKPINKSGMYNFHLLRDEALAKGEMNPKLSSAFRNLAEQVQRTRELNPDANILSVDKDLKYPGGLGDTSHFNSIIVVSNRFMEALKILTGDFHRRGSKAAKPIISFASDGEAAFLGKTMFMVDSRFEPYLKNNKLDMVMFDSAVKTRGRDYDDSIIDLDKYRDMDEFLASTNIDKTVGLPIESIQMQSWHAEDKPARIPMQVANDLVGQKLNDAYFKWLNRPAVRNYEDKLSSIVGGGNISRMTAFAKFLIGNVGDDVDNVMYSTMSRWLSANGYPMFLPFKASMKNAMMREFIDKAGMISPENHHGSQSVLVPSYYEFDHVNGLRNVLFEKAANGIESVYTVGQAEIGMNNYTKRFDPQNTNVVVHRENAADALMTWKDFISDIRGDLGKRQVGQVYIKTKEQANLNAKMKGNIEGFVFGGKREHQLGRLHDWLVDLNKYLDKNITVEVAGVFQRTPSTRSSDKVVAGIKGFVDGNFARLNTVDLWTRLEADHDYDKLNYWWDTPTDILNAWYKMAPDIKSVVNTSEPTSIRELDLLNPSSLRKYNFDSQISSKRRGEVIKIKRVFQFMKHYRGENGERGYNITFPTLPGEPKTVIRINPDRMMEAETKTTDDIQSIVDSKDGWTEGDFSDYYRDILFGKEGSTVKVDKDGETIKTEYRGLFEKGVLIKDKGKEYFQPEEIKPVEQDIIMASLQPYKGFLQLATDTYDGGEAKRVNYDSFITGFDTYSDAMLNLEAYVLRSMRRNPKYEFKDYAKYFYSDATGGKKPVSIFGLQDARLPKIGRRGEQMINLGSELLPFDRSVWASASVDRMGLEEPYKSHDRSEESFNDMWSDYIDKDSGTDAVVRKIVNSIKDDAKNFELLNILDRKIGSARSGLRRAKRYNDENLESWLQDRVNRLKGVRDKVNKNILLDEGATVPIAKTIRRQLMQSIVKGLPVDLVTMYKDTQGNIKYGKKQSVGPEQTGRYVKQRQDWIKKNMRRIVASTWQNNKLAIEIKGISSNDYAQLVMWHRTLAEKTGFMLDPRTVPYSEAFEISVSESRRELGKRWSSWFKKKDYAPHEREDIVQADIMSDMRTEWGRWNDMQDGLGNLWILKFMTPQPDGMTATYHQGKFLPGFSEIDKQIKYTTLGMNFLSTNPEILDIPIARQVAKEAGLSGRQTDLLVDKRQLLIRELAESFTDKMRALYNQESPRQNAKNMSGEERLKAALGGDDIGSSIFATSDVLLSGDSNAEMISEAKQVFKAIDKGEINTIQDLNPDMKLLYGVTGDLSLDYLSLKGAPAKIDQLLDIKNMARFYFMPNKVLNSRGKLENIKDLKGYYNHVKRNDKIYFGDLSEKNMLVKDKVSSIDMNPFGSPIERNVETGEQAKQVFRDNIMGC